MITGIEHTAVYSRDTTKLRNWYASVLNFKTVYDSGKGTYFIHLPDGSMLELVEAGSQSGPIGEKDSGLRHLAFTVDNFEETVNK